jgi:hypothetical protein
LEEELYKTLELACDEPADGPVFDSTKILADDKVLLDSGGDSSSEFMGSRENLRAVGVVSKHFAGGSGALRKQQTATDIKIRMRADPPRTEPRIRGRLAGELVGAPRDGVSGGLKGGETKGGAGDGGGRTPDSEGVWK